MSSDEWILVIDRAIAIGEDFQIEDEDSGRTFNYDLEALHDIKTSLEAGATSDEIENQFEEFVQDDFGRYVAVLGEALDDDGEQESPDEDVTDLATPELIHDDIPSLSEVPSPSSPGGGGFDDPSIDDPDKPSGDSEQRNLASKNKGLIITAAFVGLTLVILAGGFVGWKIYTDSFSSVPQANNVQPVLKSKPKPTPSESGRTTASASKKSSKTSSAEDPGYTVSQMDDSPQPTVAQPPVADSSVVALTEDDKASVPVIKRSIDEPNDSNKELESLRENVESRIAGLEGVIADQVGDRLGSLSEKLESLESRLLKIDELERAFAQQKSEEDTKSDELEQKLKGLTRLGEFSILKTAGLENRVVALSPTNRVITLEEGEQNVLAAGSNLTVQEIIGDGAAVIFTDGWFIDEVRAPESLREQNLAQELSGSASRNSQDKDEPSVSGTAKQAESPSPAVVALKGSSGSSGNAIAESSTRFPTIKRAPTGWEATALIPPRRAVLVTPDGDSITVSSGSQIADLGKVHSVKQERVLVGQYYIPLSNL